MQNDLLLDLINALMQPPQLRESYTKLFLEELSDQELGKWEISIKPRPRINPFDTNTIISVRIEIARDHFITVMFVPRSNRAWNVEIHTTHYVDGYHTLMPRIQVNLAPGQADELLRLLKDWQAEHFPEDEAIVAGLPALPELPF